MASFFTKLIGSLLGEKNNEKPEDKDITSIKSSVAQRPLNTQFSADIREPAGGGKSHIVRLIENILGKIRRSMANFFSNTHSVAITGALIAIGIILLSFTPFFFYLRGLFLVILFIILAALSKFIQKFFPFVVGFDMCLFFTVIIGIAYGPIAGIVAGVISSAMGSLVRGQYSMEMVIIPLTGYIAVGLLLPFLSGMGVLYAGMISAVVYIAMMSIIFWFIMYSITNTATFIVTGLLFNYWLFANYSQYFLSLMGA